MTSNLLTTIFVSGLMAVLFFRIYTWTMRSGSINPLDWFWGQPLYHNTGMDQDELLCEVNQFPGDEYMIDWRITMTEKWRDKGPWFARRKKFVAFSASWTSVDKGIPVNRGYIRDTWCGFFDIKDPFDWRLDADEQLKAWIKKTRHENGYVGQITEMVNDENGITISGTVFDEQLQAILSEGTIKGMSIGYGTDTPEPQAVFYDGFGAPISNPDPKVIKEARIISWGPDKNGLGEITTSTPDTDDLKARYTIEELATQAINRDNEEALMDEPVVMHGPYPEEKLNIPDPSSSWGGVLLEDDGTMEDGVKNLREAIVGHKIVKIEKDVDRPGQESWYNNKADVVLTLDNGKRVAVIAQEDCCAYGAVENVVEKLPTLDHIITDVATTDGYTKWHIIAGMEDVLELEVGWNPGNAFYYPYGVFIEVYDIPQDNQQS